ncbi:MAG TPA: DUF4062 domain-containing protein [Gemmataceae bacterium]|nr:DUF4062 domain-containing protein [Gemmataceae bacterium]
MTDASSDTIRPDIVIDSADERLRIMLSSTTVDLPHHRELATHAITRQGHTPIVMEHGSAEWQSSAIKFSLERVEQSQVYIGIFALRYGYIPDDPIHNPHRLSVTELEYRRAVELRLPTLIFLADKKHPFEEDQIDFGAEEREKLKKLKDKFRTEEICGFFDSPEKLLRELLVALPRLKVRLTRDSNFGTAPARAFVKPPELFSALPAIPPDRFIGRNHELELLDAWAQSADPIMVVEGIGGLGKSAVTWEWLKTRADRAISGLKGRVWWSFYQRGASVREFVRYTVGYLTGQHPESLRETEHEVLCQMLLTELRHGPHLLILDGFERMLTAYHCLDKAQLDDARIDVNGRDCVYPPDGDLLEQLLHCHPSKILISTRLFPSRLEGRGGRRLSGVAHHKLNGLAPSDALALMRHAGIKGDEREMLDFADSFGRHSLLLHIVCGMIKDYRRKPNDFDAWRADQNAGGNLRLRDLDLRQKHTHIIEGALAGVDFLTRRLLSGIAQVSASADYRTMEVLSPFSTAPELDAALTELENRGLLQWDRDTNTYDLHPLVRGYAAELPEDAERKKIYEKLRKHFASLPSDDLKNAREIADLKNTIEIYRYFICEGLLDDAVAFYRGVFGTTLLVHVGAYQLTIELLKPLFPQGFEQLPRLASISCQSYVLNVLGILYSQTGREPESLAMFIRVLQLDIECKKWAWVPGDLSNISDSLKILGRRAEAAMAQWLADAVAKRIQGADDVTVNLLDSLSTAIQHGRFADVERQYQDFQERPRPSINLYRPGRAEFLLAKCHFMQGQLIEAEWKTGYDLAFAHRNVSDQMRFLALRAEWKLSCSQPHEALNAIDHALLISNKTGSLQPDYHDLRAWAFARLDRTNEAREELSKGEGRGYAAEAWSAMGERDHTRSTALASYTWAWGEGPPHIEWHELERAKRLLRELNEPEPQLPPFDSSKVSTLPCEELIRAALPTLAPQPTLFLIRGNDSSGRAAWYYLEIAAEHKQRFETEAKQGQIQLTDYGTIILSGYGEYPPLDIRNRMRDQYDFWE